MFNYLVNLIFITFSSGVVKGITMKYKTKREKLSSIFGVGFNRQKHLFLRNKFIFVKFKKLSTIGRYFHKVLIGASYLTT